jgi:hypothetical protein
LIAVGILAFGGGWIQGFRAVPRVDVAAIERNAIAGRDAHWRDRLAQSERESEAKIAEWQRLAEEAEAKDPTPTTAPEIAKLCEKDPLCEK